MTSGMASLDLDAPIDLLQLPFHADDVDMSDGAVEGDVTEYQLYDTVCLVYLFLCEVLAAPLPFLTVHLLSFPHVPFSLQLDTLRV